jgi:putative oxidoreductase
MSKTLQLGFLPRSADLGLLLVRLWFGLGMFLNHGWPKLAHFGAMSGHFMDPLGIGVKASLFLAVLAEVICAALVVVGWVTRLAAIGLAIEMGVALSLVHHGVIAPGPGSGELAFLYLGAALTLVLAGAGRYSVDGG